MEKVMSELAGWMSDGSLRDELVLQQGTKKPLLLTESCGRLGDELKHEPATREQPLVTPWNIQ